MFDKIDLKFASDRDGSRAEIDAIRKIEAALTPLSRDEQARVIRAVAVLYSIDLRQGPATPPIPAPAPPSVRHREVPHARPRQWGMRKKPAPKHCRLCDATGHDKRKCPLNFEITVDDK